MVAIPLLTLVPGALGGSETYVRELLRGLGRLDADGIRVVLPPAAPDAAEGLPAVIAREYRNAHTIPERLAAVLLGSLMSSRLRPYVEDADVVHFPLTIDVPRTARPTVVTLHDLQHLDLLFMFPRAERVFRSVFWHGAVRRADRVIVVSEFVRDTAERTLGVPREKLRVVPLGVDHARLRPANVEREPFLLYPAKRWRHKNHERLFEAFALLRSERPQLRLVLTGGGDYPGLPPGVEARGRVSWEDLRSLMQRAAALVFPSLYEGFGLPPLEAMACGCPVACSDAGALREVVGDAARLFDPRDPREIADAVREVLDDPAPWVERGLAHASGYSWDATARATRSVYDELA